MPSSLAVDLGTMPFPECSALQQRVHIARSSLLIPDTLLLVEHPHVLTFGRRGKKENLRVCESVLEARGISCHTAERGGDITYHGPGQLVGYPIVSIRGSGTGVAGFVDRLEEVMLRSLRDSGIVGTRNHRNRGVWVGGEKIGFIGIAVRRGISFHGFSLNVDPDLSCFDLIHPCGLADVCATSIKTLLDRKIRMEDIKKSAIAHFGDVFETRMLTIPPAMLLSMTEVGGERPETHR